MDKDMKKGIKMGAVIGLIFAIIIIGAAFWYTNYSRTPDQKTEINNAYAVNCTKCLQVNNVTCTADTLQYSSFGAICNTDYVPKTCESTCRRI